MRTRDVCPVCGESEAAFLVKMDRNYLVDSAEGRKYDLTTLKVAGLDLEADPDAGLSYYECNGCGAFYLKDLVDLESALGESRCRNSETGEATVKSRSRDQLPGVLDRADLIAILLAMAKESTEGGSLAALDYGCGNGTDLALLRAMGASPVVGFDLDVGRTEMVREYVGPDVTLVNDVDALAGLGPFDAVQCNMVLEHVFDPNETVDRIRSLLKPGGVAYISAPSEDRKTMRRDVPKVEKGTDAGWMNPGHVQMWNNDTLPLSKYVEGRGFEIIPVPQPRSVRDATGLGPGLRLTMEQWGSALRSLTTTTLYGLGRHKAGAFFARRP